MTMSWIVVANRAGARFFEHPGAGRGLELVLELEHPKGRLKDLDFNADHPGRAFDRHGEGRHSYSREHSPTDQETQLFVKEIAAALEQERQQNRFEQLVLVADPSILGMLRDELGDVTAQMIIASLDKNLLHLDARELGSHVAPFLAVGA